MHVPRFPKGVFKRLSLIMLALSMLAVIVPSQLLQAEDKTTYITLAVDDFQKEIFTPEMMADFEKAHPGVKVNVVGGVPSFAPLANSNTTDYLAAVQKMVSLGDVIAIDDDHISPTATLAGNFLDLSPLVNADSSLNISDFSPAAWRAFQWDNGIWALPTAMEPYMLTYDPAQFDKAGIAYPDGKWTFDDFENAIRKLTQKDASGNVTVYGLDSSTPQFGWRALLASMSGGTAVDASLIPNVPKFDTPIFQQMLDKAAQLNSEGLIGKGHSDTAAMTIAPAGFIMFQAVNASQSGSSSSTSSSSATTTGVSTRAGALMPGGKAGLDANGFAVSAGTPYPDLAYALVSWLTTRAEATRFTPGIPARQSLSGSQDNPILSRMTPELKAMLDLAIANGLSNSDLRYTDYLSVALNNMQKDHVDAHTALQPLQAQAIKDQQTAIAAKPQNHITLATPAPVIVAVGKVTVKFGLASFFRPLLNQAQWDQISKDFAASDPQVGQIDMRLADQDFDQAAANYDCFYMPYNAVPGASLNEILPLDPYVTGDANFDKSDVVGNIVSQLSQDGKLWALPVNIQPELMKYDRDQFARAGIPTPAADWTIDAFNDALKALKPDADNPPFTPFGPGGTYLLSLIAAEGGLPMDFRTNPPTLNLTDPATIQAIQQVLDLAKAHYIKYSAIGSVGGVILFKGGSGDNPPAITTEELGGLRISRAGPDANQPDPYTPILYPKGSKYTALTYSVGTAYISAKTQYADACYRWISTVSRHPELFSTMPARHSLINDPTIAAVQGKDMTAVYNQIDTVLKDPNTISFPSLFQGGRSASTGFLEQHWVFEAFDSYVLNGKDLASSLKDAEGYITSFEACVSKLPPYDASSGQTEQQYQKQFIDCGVKADPRLSGVINR